MWPVFHSSAISSYILKEYLMDKYRTWDIAPCETKIELIHI